ncbi:pimeloyl-ACP methyl ester carboxylesterase [Agromyces terreus]|uniref:Pimeloyl-ACP methyl ester carboxylesterase n=1 Tax=Agromyces terreus TaxID=424795 RepID=A0A9X2H2J1_9MICO|nr:alpha/beta hydrolase [Agromyces terreus]MCP2369677.1 pimeloyl-ACP methyl ester carboxylesterase [Agromyces terreus]
MSDQKPTVVLVHGAFAESASWNGVIERLHAEGIASVAAANPLRSLAGDAAYVRDVLASVDGPIVLVGHSYGGLVISEASAGDDRVAALVYAAAFVPEQGDTAFSLSASEPGSTLGDALDAHPVATGGVEFVIRRDRFHEQFAADVPAPVAGLMGATQRPVTQTALTDAVQAAKPGWTDRPSWHVFGSEDRNIPVAVHRAGAERAGARGTTEIAGASHAITVSQPEEVAATILEAVRAVTGTRAAA